LFLAVVKDDADTDRQLLLEPDTAKIAPYPIARMINNSCGQHFGLHISSLIFSILEQTPGRGLNIRCTASFGLLRHCQTIAQTTNPKTFDILCA
jgi:hypothetical protein